MFYAISYDIQKNRNRNKVAKLLKDYGPRVQLSVFEVHLDGKDLEKLVQRLEKEIDPENDSIRIYPLCGACKPDIIVIGQGTVTQLIDVIII